MDNQSGRDLLSDLPLGIIHNILALVPITEAVRTSILAKHWRYIWTTLPQLFFTNWDYELLDEDEGRVISFINNVLILHKGPIHNFEISIHFRMSCPNIDNWLLSLSRNDIRELKIYLGDDWLKMPSNLYSCQMLTHLEFCASELPAPPPTFKGFLCLRCLDVTLTNNKPSYAIESLVASSPLLENLTLNEEYGSPVFRISAPNLKYFEITSVHKEICVHAPLLVKMSVHFDRWGDGDEDDDNNNDDDDDDFTVEHLKQASSVCNYTKLLGSCTNLESLRVRYFTKNMSVDIKSYQSSLVFHQLKLIQLQKVSFLDVKVISVVLHLITDSPNLHKLEISVDHFGENTSEAAHDGSIWDSACASSFRFEKLRTIEMKKIRGLPNEMEFIKILLKSSPVLETMILGDSNKVGTKGILKLMSELLWYDRASANAKISCKPHLSRY